MVRVQALLTPVLNIVASSPCRKDFASSKTFVEADAGAEAEFCGVRVKDFPRPSSLVTGEAADDEAQVVARCCLVRVTTGREQTGATNLLVEHSGPDPSL